ncbi:hypothetical protein FHS57_006226 [Runella defluvii]|uniref:Uncharacterized protein n=1 Tax=Runella defluvii TaxID=370973 RepID=A0A7W5ZRA2_9BACT|nr:hypothetical protein [Runella defluvii]MBB3842195.1 hypothetical protein [Runella defluvii]
MKLIENIGLVPTLLIAFAITVFAFFGIDICAGKRQNDIVVVYEKQFIPAYSETYVEIEHHLVNDQNVSIPVVKTRHHPDEYIFYVDDYQHRYTLHTNAQTFFAVNPRQEVRTRFVKGRWTKLKYFEKVIY